MWNYLTYDLCGMDEKQILGTGECRRCEQEMEIQVQERARARQKMKQLEDRIREEGSGPRFHDVFPSSPEKHL